VLSLAAMTIDKLARVCVNQEAWYGRNAYLNHVFPRKSLRCWATTSVCYGFGMSRKRPDSAARPYIDASPTGLFRSRAA
jgi:hypothetical protein